MDAEFESSKLGNVTERAGKLLHLTAFFYENGQSITLGLVGGISGTCFLAAVMMASHGMSILLSHLKPRPAPLELLQSMII